MDENTLRCPQCGSPVLDTAKYCVICGIRLPEPASDANDPPGWTSVRSSNDPIDPIPPIDIPEFDDPVEDESTIDIEAAGGADDTYDPIPDIELDDLDRFIANGGEQGAADVSSELIDAGNDPGPGELETPPDVESDDEAIEMIDEGAPAYGDLTAPDGEIEVDPEPGDLPAASVEPIEDDETESVESLDSPEDPEASDMIEEGAPVFDSPEHEYEASDSADNAEIDVEQVGYGADDEEAPAKPSEPNALEPIIEEDDIETDEEAIDMIDEGGPAFDDATAPERDPQSDSDEPAGEDEAGEAMATNPAYESEPPPMISASYPDDAIDTKEPGFDPAGEHWWPEDSDDDWVYFEAERAGAMSMTEDPGTETAADSIDGGAFERAQALVEELNALLPQLGRAADVPGGPDFNELRALAIAGRGDQSFDDWAALRQVVDSAVGRPTDIETILQLSKRVDDIAALIAERDRLQDAFTRALEWIDAVEER